MVHVDLGLYVRYDLLGMSFGVFIVLFRLFVVLFGGEMLCFSVSFNCCLYKEFVALDFGFVMFAW